jgi:hypothetical protein
VSVEWSDDLNTLLTVTALGNLDLGTVIKDTSEGDWLEVPVLFKGVGFMTRPWEASTVLWSDINSILAEGFGSVGNRVRNESECLLTFSGPRRSCPRHVSLGNQRPVASRRELGR